MQINKVAAKFKNGAVKKGTTSDFSPKKVMFHLISTTGEILDINIEELKAVYFIKNFEGDKDRMDKYTDDVPGEGRKVQIKFSDGEMLIGYTHGYSPTRSGFFVIPADLQNNNDRIYVITSATEKVTFLNHNKQYSYIK
jgi:hypothetical protein